MTPFLLRAGLCALVAAGTATLASAQTPLVVRTPGGNTTVITNSGNGVGNRIVVSGTRGTTIVQNVRNGIGNRLILDPDELLIDLDELCPPRCKPAPKPACYHGKANAFWTRKQFSDDLDCHLYWSDTDRLWFRYHSDDDAYRPLKAQPAAPPADPLPVAPPPTALPDR